MARSNERRRGGWAAIGRAAQHPKMGAATGDPDGWRRRSVAAAQFVGSRPQQLVLAGELPQKFQIILIRLRPGLPQSLGNDQQDTRCAGSLAKDGRQVGIAEQNLQVHHQRGRPMMSALYVPSVACPLSSTRIVGGTSWCWSERHATAV
jgi:hypothetical protein